MLVCQAMSEGGLVLEPERGVAREFHRRARKVCVLSTRMIETIERQLIMKSPNAVVVRNPVNLQDTSAIAWPRTTTARFAAVGYLEERKSPDLLLQALGGAAWRARDWLLTFHGKGDLDAYRALAAHYGIADKVHFAGHSPDVRKIWADSEMLLLPARMEGVPLAMVEAMLCGRPALVTAVGGNREWIVDGVTGFLAEAPTAESIGASLEVAWAQRARWPEVGAAARSKALQAIDPEPGKTLLGIMKSAAGR